MVIEQNIAQNRQAILYDTGASYPSGFNMAEAVLLPYFQTQGIHQLEKSYNQPQR